MESCTARQFAEKVTPAAVGDAEEMQRLLHPRKAAERRGATPQAGILPAHHGRVVRVAPEPVASPHAGGVQEQPLAENRDRLEVQRVGVSQAEHLVGCIDVVARGIDHVDIGVAVEKRNLLPQPARVHDVVGVHAGEESAACDLADLVQTVCESPVGTVADDAYARIADAARDVQRAVAGAVVYQDQLPILEVLREYGADGRSERAPVVVKGDADGDSHGLRIRVFHCIFRLCISSALLPPTGFDNEGDPTAFPNS
jgi:hypothetical protein